MSEGASVRSDDRLVIIDEEHADCLMFQQASNVLIFHV
jgi:hypothetical protein